MEHWQYIPGIVLAVVTLLLTARSAARKRRARLQRDFTRKLETLLLPRETVKIVCPQKKGSCILTSRRLLFETKEGFHAVPLTKIRRVQGQTGDGKRTTAVDKMASFTIYADKEFTLYPAENFPELVKQLQKKTQKKKGNGKKK